MFKSLLSKNLPRNRRLYALCKRYVDRYNAENDNNIETNGELRLMQTMLPRCNVVFDVGANVGNWTAQALKLNPAMQVHCFEPSPTTFERLLANRFPPNVICNNFGLSSASTTARLHIFQDGGGMNSLYQRHGLEEVGHPTQQRDEEIRLETMEQYCATNGIQQVDFVKVDVEGHELQVFNGMLGLLKSKQIKMIQFEYGGCNIDARVLLKDYFDLFGSLGYPLYKLYPHETRRIPRYDQRLENFQYQNWLVVADPALLQN